MNKKEYISTILLSIILVYFKQFIIIFMLNVCVLYFIISNMNSYLEKFLFVFSITMIIFSIIKIV